MERTCPACGLGAGAPAGWKDKHQLRRCLGCASLFVAMAPSADAGEDYENYYHDGNLEVPEFVHRRLDELVAELASYRRSNLWLDVGCGAGALLEAAGRAGWNAQGTEIALRAVERLTARGLDVRLGDVVELSLPEETYDVVTLIEVLEHVAEPRKLLAHVTRLLRPGGVLHLTTPHGRGLSARLLGPRWSVVSPPEHLQLFSRRGLRAAARTAGLAEVQLLTHAVNPYELIGALRIPGTPDRPAGGNDRVQTSYRFNEALHRRRSGIWLKRGVNAALSTLRLGDALKFRAVRPAR